jgi:hypothetical protein
VAGGSRSGDAVSRPSVGCLEWSGRPGCGHRVRRGGRATATDTQIDLHKVRARLPRSKPVGDARWAPGRPERGGAHPCGQPLDPGVQVLLACRSSALPQVPFPCSPSPPDRARTGCGAPAPPLTWDFTDR